MSRIDSIPSSSLSSPAPFSEPELARRLIVLVPDLEWNHIPAIHRIWELAELHRARVLLLTLCKDARQEPGLRRGLVILCAMLQDGSIPVETNVEIGMNWVDVIKRNYRHGDMIVCFAEQRAGLLYRPLSQILQSDQNIPIYILSGFYSQRSSRFNKSLIGVWMGFLGIMVGSFLLQLRIVSLPQNWAQTTLLIMSVLAELWLIWIWNNLFS